MTVTEAFQAKAHAAVAEWDGQHNGELILLLADHLGVSVGELVMSVEVCEPCHGSGQEDGLSCPACRGRQWVADPEAV